MNFWLSNGWIIVRARTILGRVPHVQSTAARVISMMASLEAAMERGARTVWLAVWERNLRAQAFYRKCGFEDCGAKDFLLGRDRQTDRVMVRAV